MGTGRLQYHCEQLTSCGRCPKETLSTLCGICSFHPKFFGHKQLPLVPNPPLNQQGPGSFALLLQTHDQRNKPIHTPRFQEDCKKYWVLDSSHLVSGSWGRWPWNPFHGCVKLRQASLHHCKYEPVGFHWEVSAHSHGFQWPRLFCQQLKEIKQNNCSEYTSIFLKVVSQSITPPICDMVTLAGFLPLRKKAKGVAVKTSSQYNWLAWLLHCEIND